VRIELFGDTIESIRAFDPGTQRSTNPMERTTLLPLTEFPYPAEVLQHSGARSASGRDDELSERGFYPGWEFREILREDRKSVLFDLSADPVLVLDEPSTLASEVEKYRTRLTQAYEDVEDPLAEPAERYIFGEDEWSLALQLFPRLALEQLELSREGDPSKSRPADAADYALSRKRRRLHGRSEGTCDCGRAGDGVGGEHGRTRALRGYLPRIRTPLPARRA
jgi:transcription-repair coupling factor (superfamily II helicase)